MSGLRDDVNVRAQLSRGPHPHIRKERERVGQPTSPKANLTFGVVKANPDRLALIEHCAKLLRDAGHEVLSVHGNFLEVKAMPGQVWEALSGQPSDPKREAVHL